MLDSLPVTTHNRAIESRNAPEPNMPTPAIMTRSRVDAIVAGAFNLHFGGKGEAMTPAKARKLSRQDRVALLHVLKTKGGDTLYTPEEHAHAFSAAVNEEYAL